MTEPLSDEQKANLVAGYASGEVSEENQALYGSKPRQKATTFSRLPVVIKPPAVVSPKGWFPRGRVDKIQEERF